MKLAAIDIGSNAARLLVNDVIQDADGKPEFIKVAIVRVPLRLGFDVFEYGRISEVKAEKLLKAIKAYQLLIDVHEVVRVKACATSAMRDASNASEVLQKIKAETGVDIKVITGQEEAAYIYENHIAENLNHQKTYLYIDVGGGSTELTFYGDGKLNAKDSFNIGTIRLLKKHVDDSEWKRMETFLNTNIKSSSPVTCIGSGGNINAAFSLSNLKDGQPLNLQLLQEFYHQLSTITTAERMSLYHMREDRADVIVPALQIFITIMQQAGAEEIYVPKIGLADGLIHVLYDEVTSGKALQ